MVEVTDLVRGYWGYRVRVVVEHEVLQEIPYGIVDYTAYLNALEADPETPYPANSSWDKLMLPGKTG